MSPLCDVDGCERLVENVVWCHGHYERQRRGDPLGGPILDTPEKRFHAKVAYGDEHDLWTGATGGNGRYGTFAFDGRNRPAHRVALILAGIPDPGVGYDVDHLCRVTQCVRPSHLEFVTHQENILRGVGIAACNAVKTHCKRGHEFTPQNTRPMANGGRYCLACELLRYAARRRGGHLRDFPDLDLLAETNAA